jgi:hypothetical protein
MAAIYVGCVFPQMLPDRSSVGVMMSTAAIDAAVRAEHAANELREFTV